jgi:hypothetical protein
MSKSTINMQRKWLLVPIGIVSLTLLSGYLLFGMSPRRPLPKIPIFSDEHGGIAPSSFLDKEKWSAAFGLARDTLAAPVFIETYMIDEQHYDVPLPTNSFRNSDRDSQRNNPALRSYITLATRQELDAYYSTTLPEAGWKFSDRMGAVRIYRKNNARLAISDSFYQGTRISQLNLMVDGVDAKNSKR